MGIYLRKSVSVGPFRFNLSKSGVGVSVGVKGLRVGAGPRGNYVHMGRGGVYYRATIPGSTPTAASSKLPGRTRPAPGLSGDTHVDLVPVGSADAATISDSTSTALLEEIRSKRRALDLAPLAAIGLGFFALVVAPRATWAAAIFAAAACAAYLYLRKVDAVRKTTVVMYDLDDHAAAAYERLLNAASALASSSQAWHITAQGNVHDRRYHGGAGRVVNRGHASLSVGANDLLSTNVNILSAKLDGGKRSLLFFPDRLLITQGKDVGAVDYSRLHVAWDSSRFIEEPPAPVDAKVLDHTWQYVNKDGTPDRRFRGNQQLPVCLYDVILLESDTGLSEKLQFSRSGQAAEFQAALHELTSMARAH